MNSGSKMEKRNLLIWGLISVGVLLVSQIGYYTSLNRENQYGKLYLVEGTDPHDFLIVENLNLSLDHNSRYMGGFMSNQSYYQFAFIQQTHERVILEVNLTPYYSWIDEIEIHPVSLNPSRTYLGLTQYESQFWTLEKTDSWKIRSQQLISFTLEGGIITNRTISALEVDHYEELNEYYQILIGIHNDTLWLLQIGRDYINHENSFNYILGYNLSSLTLIKSISISIYQSEYLYMDPDGLLWFEAEESALGAQRNHLGLNLTTQSIDKTVSIENSLREPDYTLFQRNSWIIEIREKKPVIIFTSWDMGDKSIQKNIILYPLEGFVGSIRTFWGFRRYPVTQDFRFAPEYYFSPLGTIISLGSLALLAIVYWTEEKKEINQK